MPILAVAGTDSVPENFIPKEPYLSREFLELEKRKLWPKTWLMACREEEVAKNGQYLTFDIADESIIVVRDRAGTLRAFFNVCQHRGKRLTKGCGVAAKIFCKFHGWRWNLDGSNDMVIDRADWAGALDTEDLSLKPVLLDTWGGWVFVSMEPNVKPLRTFLAPFVEAYRNYRMEDMRLSWYKSVKVPCNWKVALDVFIEGYHAQTAHPQNNAIAGYNLYNCELFGPHSVFRWRDMPILGDPNPNVHEILGIQEETDRLSKIKGRAQAIYAFFEMLQSDLKSMVTDRMMRAVTRLVADKSDSTDYIDLMTTLAAYHREEALKEGIEWDALSPEEIAYLGMDWHMFPNVAMLPTPDGLLGYITRPNGDDPDSAFLDVFSLERFAKGKEPVVTREYYEDWRDAEWPRIFPQDFENLADIQQGMKSRGYAGGRANPIQETTVTNFHRHVREMVSAPE